MSIPKKLLIYLFIGLTIGVLTPWILFSLSKIDEEQNNGFVRRFVNNDPITFPSKILDIKFPGYYISGYTDHNLFLSNKQYPAHILMTNLLLSDTVHINMKIPILEGDSNMFSWERLYVTIDSPNVYMADGQSGAILEKDLLKPQIIRQKLSDFSFEHYIPLSSSGFIFKSYDTNLAQNILVKRTIEAPALNLPQFVFDKQVDGQFCTDGMLLHAKEASHMLYVYYYRNQIICLDSMLRTVYTSKTIDTISFANIRVSEIKSGTRRTLSKYLMVNRRSCVSGNYLFINSELRGENENPNIFKMNSVLDVYDHHNGGKYISSFYVPKYKDKKPRNFQVIGDVFYALYSTHLVAYPLQNVLKLDLL